MFHVVLLGRFTCRRKLQLVARQIFAQVSDRLVLTGRDPIARQVGTFSQTGRWSLGQICFVPRERRIFSSRRVDWFFRWFLAASALPRSR